MIQVEGKFARYHRGLPYAARVTVQVDPDAREASITTHCTGQPDWSQGNMLEASATGYGDWKDGAEAGVRQALRIAKQEQCSVCVIQILGLDTDTNPTVIGAAAMNAVWQALEFTPPPSVVAQVEQIVFGSWEKSYDFVPDFEGVGE